MDVHRLAFRSYTVILHHVGKGRSRPAISIYHNWHGAKLLRHYAHPSWPMLRKLMRALIVAHRSERCIWEPGYPSSTFTYTHYNHRNPETHKEIEHAR